MKAASAVMRFGPFSIDPQRRQLLRERVPVHLTPKAFDLVCLLVAEAPRVVGKHELHERLWLGTFVSDSSLTGLIKELRRALQDNDADAPVIRTVHRVGYACELEVEVLGPENRVWHWLVVDGQRVVLHQGENVIGRGPVSDVCLDFPGISRRHARIVIDVADVRLEDLGSKNGTTVGDTPVRTPVALHDGDQLAFGTIAGIYRTSKAGMSTETRSRSARRPDTAPND